MAWSDHWKYIRYGVATLVGMAATVGLYVTYQDVTGDDYITTDEYAAVLLGTVERCMATATGVSIETNTVTNVVFDYVADPSGRMWTPTGGTPTNYLVPVYVTNVDAVVSTNWTYAAEPPAVVTVERITVGRVAAVVTNGGAVYTNDSPAVLTNGMTNAVTAYIPAGAIRTLWDAASNAIPYYVNTNAGVDAWTVTGMFFACGFTNGWDTNAGPEYVAKTNLAQLYTVLSRLRHRSFSAFDGWFISTQSKSVLTIASSVWPHPITNWSFADAEQQAETVWPIDVAAASEVYKSTPFRVYTSKIQPFADEYNVRVRHESLRPVVSFYPWDGWWHPILQWSTNTTMTFRYVASSNDAITGDEERVFDPQGCDILLGTNEITLPIIESYYSNSVNKYHLIFDPIIRLPSESFDLTWPEDPSPQGHRSTRGFQIGDAFDNQISFANPMLVTFGFLYCTNAP